MVVGGIRGRLAPAPATVAAMTGRLAWQKVASFALTAALVVGLANFNGGFYPSAWGFGALASCCVAIVALLGANGVDLARREWLMLGGLAAFLAWIAVTAMRPDLATAAVPELERGGLYLGVVWAALLVLRRRTVAACLAGLLTAIVAVCCAALATYLLPAGGPDTYEGRLLFQPLGYANAVGIFAGMGVVLALAFATHAHVVRARALAAGSLVPLVATLAFTASRASTASMILGIGVVGALDPARRHCAAVATVVLPLPLLVVWASSRTHIGDSQAGTNVVAHDGRVVAVLIVLVTLALVVVAHAALKAECRARTDRKLGFLALMPGGFVFAAAMGLAIVTRAAGASGDRPAYWKAAWHDYVTHPLVGSGAGSFEAAWLHYRTVPSSTVDAHNLYLETLAELGPLGLILLAAVLLLPLTAVLTARRRDPLAVAAAGVYTAFLSHAALDWDWEMPAVTVVALVSAVAVLKAARTGDTRRRAAPIRVVVLWVTLTCVFAAVTAVGLAGSVKLAASASAADSGDWASAQRLARSASRWQPWSAEPFFILGETQLVTGDRRAARQSFVNALDHDSRDWRTWYELARVSPAARHDAILEIAQLNPFAVRRSVR